MVVLEVQHSSIHNGGINNSSISNNSGCHGSNSTSINGSIILCLPHPWHNEGYHEDCSLSLCQSPSHENRVLGQVIPKGLHALMLMSESKKNNTTTDKIYLFLITYTSCSPRGAPFLSSTQYPPPHPAFFLSQLVFGREGTIYHQFCLSYWDMVNRY